MKALGLHLVLALALVAGCKGRAPEFSGVGQWRFTHTTLADATGACQPYDLQDGRKATWCFGQQPYKIGGRAADVDLYFLGTAKDAPLIEIQLKVRGCDEDKTDQWMRTTFGAPVGTRGTREYFQNSFLWAAALIPSEPGRCVLHFLPLSEKSEIERIKLL